MCTQEHLVWRTRKSGCRLSLSAAPNGDPGTLYSLDGCVASWSTSHLGCLGGVHGLRAALFLCILLTSGGCECEQLPMDHSLLGSGLSPNPEFTCVQAGIAVDGCVKCLRGPWEGPAHLLGSVAMPSYRRGLGDSTSSPRPPWHKRPQPLNTSGEPGFAACLGCPRSQACCLSLSSS